MNDDAKKSSTENTKNTFFGKAIENWLTNTNELGYQLPFCQILLNEGLRIIHISKHNAFEQGKDIIAQDSDGVSHVYQLKGGNVSLRQWRDLIKAECDELIDLSIVHPSVDKSKPFIPYLVTNGYLDDTVRLQIENLNAGKWKDTPLRVVVLGELLERFRKWSYEFTPQEISNYKDFLDLYFSNGRELVDEERISRFLESVTRVNVDGLNNEERKRNISATILLTGYVLEPFRREENYIAITQILTFLASHILAVAEKFKLPEKKWKDSFDVVWGEIEWSARSLEKEVLETDFKELHQTLFDGEIAPYRKQIAITYIFAFCLSQFVKGSSDWKSISAEKYIEYLKLLVVWGESAFFGQIFAYLYGRSFAKEGDSSPQILLKQALELIILLDGRKSAYGLPTPYYPIQLGMKVNLGLLEDEVGESFQMRSYFLKSIIHLLVRAGRRDLLEKHWRDITYIQMEQFTPEEHWMYFVRRVNQGTHSTEFPVQTESWKQLVVNANTSVESELPEKLVQIPYFLPLYLLAFPYRINASLIHFLDNSCKVAKES